MLVRKLLIILYFLISIPCAAQGIKSGTSWEETLKRKSGTLVVTWYTSKPFIYRDNRGNLAGIEYEVIIHFQRYLLEVYGITLKIDWQENTSFSGVYGSIKNSSADGLVGISAFSITPERQQAVGFAPPYMSDISVMISSYDVPYVNNTTEFKEVFNNLKAVTIEATTYEQDLINLRSQYTMDYEIEYIPSSDNILRSLETMERSFGFIDLPIYLSEFSRNSSVRVKRQNLFPIKRIGYSLIYPLESDWQAPLEQYFLSSLFQRQRESIFGKYLDKELFDFISNLYASRDQNTFLLTMEKQIQNEALIGKTQQIEREETLRNYLLLGGLVVVVSLLIITWQYVVRNKTARLLQRQKEQIDSQRLDIQEQKVALEHRNERLMELNEEKNHLIQILAHDLRSPIHQIIGLTQILLMENELNESQQKIIEGIKSSSSRVSNMISKILDVDSLDERDKDLTMELVQLSSFTQSVVERFRQDAAHKAITITFSASSTAFVLADSVHLGQVIENVLSNALKFSDSGKKVLVSIVDAKDQVELRVQDQGPGFTEEDRRNMFKKFQRLSARPTASEPSTGLGLSIVKRYVERMCGSIRLESTGRTGSTFLIAFPRHEVKTPSDS